MDVDAKYIICFDFPSEQEHLDIVYYFDHLLYLAKSINFYNFLDIVYGN